MHVSELFCMSYDTIRKNATDGQFHFTKSRSIKIAEKIRSSNTKSVNKIFKLRYILFVDCVTGENCARTKCDIFGLIKLPRI